MKTLNKIVLVVCILIIMYYIYQSGYRGLAKKTSWACPVECHPPANPVFPTSGSVKAPVAFASSTLASIITDIDGAIFVHVSA